MASNIHEEESLETKSHDEPLDDHSDDGHSSPDNEHHSDTKINSPPGTFTMEDFAKYTKNDDKTATLKLSSLGITLNLNYMDLSGKKEQKHEEDDVHGEAAEELPDWNYDLHGSDWGARYPNCDTDF